MLPLRALPLCDCSCHGVRLCPRFARRVVVRSVRAGSIGGLDRSLHGAGDVGRLTGLNAIENDLVALDDVVEHEMADVRMSGEF